MQFGKLSRPARRAFRFPRRQPLLDAARRAKGRRLLLERLEQREVFAAFTPGNLLVLQAANETVSNASAVNLLEYTTNGTLVQTIPVASSGPQSLTLRGTSTTEGILSISADGSLVTFGGYRADAGTIDPSGELVDRVIAKVGSDGVVNTSQGISDAYLGDSFRSVVTDDGTRFWMSGAGAGVSGSVRFVANTTDNFSTPLTDFGGNTRQVQILEGNLFVSAGSNVPGRTVWRVGNGLPTSGIQTFTPTFPITTQQYNNFYFADLNNSVGWDGTSFDTLYTVDTNGTAGAVNKWSYDGMAWVATGNIAFVGMANIVGFTNGSSVTLYGTNKTSGNSRLVSLTDNSGYNANMTGSWNDLVNPVLAGGTTAFRGITRVPVSTVTQLAISPTDAIKLEGDAGTTAFTFTVSRSGPLGSTSSASWNVTGSGTNPASASDFVGNVFPSGTVQFLANEASKVITVNVNGDLGNELDETFTVTLTNPTGATISGATAQGTILNDDAATELSVLATDANKLEGNAASTTFTFTVQRSGLTAGVTSTVQYAVTGSGANPANATDFIGGILPSGTITFNPGETSKPLSIAVSGDLSLEPDEGFSVTLFNPSAGTGITGFSAAGTILNDDSTISISTTPVTANEGNAGLTGMIFNVTRSGNLAFPSDVAWAVTGTGSLPASASDFVSNAFPAGTLNFLANEAAKQIIVDVQGDLTLEGNESFIVTLNSATVGSIIAANSSGTILTDDFQNLAAGDLVITAIHGDNPDQFSFVPLVNLAAGSSIVFTDNAWNGTALNTTEGFITYTAPAGGLAAGAKVVVQYDSTPNPPEISLISGPGTVTVSGSFGISTGGDNLFAFVGLANSPNFLFGVHTGVEYLTTGTVTANTTYLPAGLAIGTSAVEALATLPATDVDNAQYNHAAGTSGTPALIRSLVADKNNWSTNDLPIAPLDTASFSVTVSQSTVVGRHVFYHRSPSTVFGNGSGNPINSLDPQKIALLPGQVSSFANYTNYVRGLNGLLVDIQGLLSATASDFLFATWSGTGVANFQPTSAIPTVSVLPGGGLNGSSRVKIEFADNAIQNAWLRVTVLANSNTLLPFNDVFYFGNAIADVNVGNIGNPIVIRTNATDTSTIRQNQSPGINSVGISNFFDLNKDGRVNATDTALARQNQLSNIIQHFTAPANLQWPLALGAPSVLLPSGFRVDDEQRASGQPESPSIGLISYLDDHLAVAPPAETTESETSESPIEENSVEDSVSESGTTPIDAFFSDFDIETSL